MDIIKEIQEDYRGTRSSKKETFGEWYLRREASDWVRFLYAGVIGAGIVWVLMDYSHVLYMFYAALICSLFYFVHDLILHK